MIKTKVIGRVFRQDEIADQIYDMWIETELAQGARPGQFVCVYTKMQQHFCRVLSVSVK